MNSNITNLNPLVIFRCKNPRCRQIFSPSSIMAVAEHKIYFKCPVCGSKYEAQYADVEALADHEAIMLLERPKMVSQGTRIASS
ncbi:MAG: hypothetical protein U9O98_00435 [Asgard group archaeon]|nr:hypothetical protein [Asgard group archaeon]